MPIDLGDSHPIAVDVKDAAGALTNAGSVVLTIIKPDGASENVPVTNPPATTGQYRVIYVPTAPGRYSWSLVTAAPNTAYADVIDVRAAVSPALISLADARAQLNKNASASDDEVRAKIEATTRIVESEVGPIIRHQESARVPGGNCALTLPHRNVLTVTAVTRISDGASPIDLAGLDVDPVGVISRKDRADFPDGPLLVVYTVGTEAVSPNWSEAARIIVQHLWRAQLGNLPVAQGDDPGYVVTGAGYLIPYRAAVLLNPDATPLGFA